MECGAKRFPLAIATVVLALVIAPHVAQAQTRNVHCPGGSIGLALRLPSILPLTIVVQGTCNENLVIQRDDVTIQAGAGGASIVSASPSATTKDVVTVDGAKRIVLSGLTISGGQNGIFAKNGAQVSVLGATIQSNLQNGISATAGANLTVDSAGAVTTTITNNGTGGNPPLGQNGVLVTDNSSVVVTNATISGNAANGVQAGRSSSAFVGVTPASVPGPVTISGNGGNGVLVTLSSQGQVQGCTIQSNGQSGVAVDLTSSAGVRQSLIQSNGGTGITVTNSSGARIGVTNGIVPTAPRRTDGSTNTISNNGSDGISITQASNAMLYGNVISGNSGRGITVARAAAQSFGDNHILNNHLDGVSVNIGQYIQAQANFPLAPFRDFIQSNGTDGNPNAAWGVTAFDHSGVRMENVEISGNHNDGILVGDSSTLDLRSADPNNRSLVTNNGTVPSNLAPFGSKPPFNNLFGAGVNVLNGSSVDLRGVLITNNKTQGIFAQDHSMVQVRSNAVLVGTTPTVVLSEISGNATNGIQCNTGSAVDVNRGSTITNNGTSVPNASPPPTNFVVGDGINAFLGCSVNVRDSTISGNKGSGINASLNSTVNVTTSSPDQPGFDGFYVFPSAALTTSISNNNNVGINIFNNSSLQMFPGGGGATQVGNAVIVTGNSGFGISCGGQSTANGNYTGVSGNNGGGNQVPFSNPLPASGFFSCQ